MGHDYVVVFVFWRGVLHFNVFFFVVKGFQPFWYCFPVHCSEIYYFFITPWQFEKIFDQPRIQSYVRLAKVWLTSSWFCWSRLTNGQQQLWCNIENWLPRCYRTKQLITTSKYLWNAGVALLELVYHIYKPERRNSLDCEITIILVMPRGKRQLS